MAGLIKWRLASIPSGNPEAGTVYAGIDIADGLFYIKDESGTVQKFPTLSQVQTAVLATQLTGIVFTNDTAVVATDTILEAMGKLQAQSTKLANLAFKDFADRTSGLVNDTATLEEYLTLSTTVPADGNYKLSASYTWSLNNGADDFIAEIVQDGSTQLYEHRQEPKDTAGTGVTLPNTGGGNTNTGTDQRHPSSFQRVLNLTAGSYDFALNFAGSISGAAAAIYRGELNIERWDNA